MNRKVHECDCTRRTAILSTAAMVLATGCSGGLVGGRPEGVSAARSISSIVDIHHHMLPPFYKKVAESWMRQFAGRSSEIMRWSPQTSLEAMEAAGVDKAVLSVPGPGMDFDRGSLDVALTRDCNDYGLELCNGHANRFGFFASVPMPNIEASILEIARADETLRANGVILMTNYRGKYLGDSSFAPIFDELNRRSMTVFVHPMFAPCCVGLIPGVLDAYFELPVDTGRTITSLLWSGTLSRCRNIKFIFSHGGGVLPMVIGRIISQGLADPGLAEKVPEGVPNALSRLYVDTASVTNPVSLASVRRWLGDEQILFGTDFPWGDPSQALQELRVQLPQEALGGISGGNYLSLIGA